MALPLPDGEEQVSVCGTARRKPGQNHSGPRAPSVEENAVARRPLSTVEHPRWEEDTMTKLRTFAVTALKAGTIGVASMAAAQIASAEPKYSCSRAHAMAAGYHASADL